MSGHSNHVDGGKGGHPRGSLACRVQWTSPGMAGIMVDVSQPILKKQGVPSRAENWQCPVGGRSLLAAGQAVSLMGHLSPGSPHSSEHPAGEGDLNNHPPAPRQA